MMECCTKTILSDDNLSQLGLFGGACCTKTILSDDNLSRLRPFGGGMLY